MTEKPENKAMPIKDDQKKPKLTKDELNEQQLNQVAGGTAPIIGGWNRVRN
jgi:hypothetical protein